MKCPNCSHTFEPEPETQRSNCPVSKIVALYHELRPELPACQKVTPKRRGQIQQRWREDLTDLDDWRQFFTDVGRSDFLMGRTPASNGHRIFRADLEWLTNPTNYAKIIEGKYNGQLSQPQSTDTSRHTGGRTGPGTFASQLPQMRMGFRNR